MHERISESAVDECVATLRYLKRAYETGQCIDSIHMEHVIRALTLVDQKNTPDPERAWVTTQVPKNQTLDLS